MRGQIGYVFMDQLNCTTANNKTAICSRKGWAYRRFAVEAAFINAAFINNAGVQ